MSRSKPYVLTLVGSTVLGWAGADVRAETEQAYYCPSKQAYYPIVSTCPVPWTPIPRVPSPAAIKPADSTAAATAAPTPIVQAPREGSASESAVPGSIAVFSFGPQQHPVECAAHQICDLVLQAGEHITLLKVGDAASWSLDSASEGSGAAQVEHLFIAPHRSGLDTSMVILTQIRTYHLRLTSYSQDYMAQISFTYPDETPVAEPAAPPPRTSMTLTPAKMEPAAAPVGPDNNLVTVNGLTYVKGREPRDLGGTVGQSLADPPQIKTPAAPQISLQDPDLQPKADEPPAPQSAPRPDVDVNKLVQGEGHGPYD